MQNDPVLLDSESDGEPAKTAQVPAEPKRQQPAARKQPLQPQQAAAPRAVPPAPPAQVQQPDDAIKKELEIMKEKYDALMRQMQAMQLNPPPAAPAPAAAPTPATAKKAPPAARLPAAKAAPIPAGDKEEADLLEHYNMDCEELSQHALYVRAKRLCQRTDRGKLQVPEDIHQQWLDGSRDEIMWALVRALKVQGFDKDHETRKRVRAG